MEGGGDLAVGGTLGSGADRMSWEGPLRDEWGSVPEIDDFQGPPFKPPEQVRFGLL